MTDLNPIFTNLAAQLNEIAGLHLSAGSAFNGQDGTFHLPATDLLALAGLVKLAVRSVPEGTDVEMSQRDDACTAAVAWEATAGRAGVDWSAAGKKSWETRRRNEAARQRANKKRS